jgi:hypothetical protein
MKKKVIMLVSCVLLMTGCEKNDGNIKYEGEAVFTSERMLSGDIYLVYGFSFEKGENIPYTYTTSPLPDVLVTNITDVHNNIIGAVLNCPGNEDAFHLNGILSTAGEAESFFNSYLEVVDSIFTPLAENIVGNQVWTIQTESKKFAKILIKELVIKTDSPVSDYVEIKVKYKYQPDGSRSFAGE